MNSSSHPTATPQTITRATRLALLITLVLSTAACGMYGYGPSEDRSRFVSARVTDDGAAVLITAKRLVYRPAAGWRAFPDGGIPRYITDENMVGVFHIDTRKTSVLHREKNTFWQDGQGEYGIYAMKGAKAVINQGGQKRSDYLPDARRFMLDIDNGDMEELSVKEDLAGRGRELGYFYMLGGDGTLLFVTPATGKPVNPNDFTGNELWLRLPDVRYAKVASEADYMGFEAGEVIYWTLGDRTIWAYDVSGGGRRRLEKYIPVSDPGKLLDSRISSDGRSVGLWVKDGDGWRFRERLLTLEDLP